MTVNDISTKAASTDMLNLSFHCSRLVSGVSFLRVRVKPTACKSIVAVVSRERVSSYLIEQPARSFVGVMYVCSRFLKPRHHCLDATKVKNELCDYSVKRKL